MSVLDVNTNQMNTDAEGFKSISALSTQIASYLQHALNLLGNFAGGDNVGETFLAQWDPAIKGMIDALSGISSGMLETANSVIKSANLYNQSNQVNSDLVG